MTKSDLLLACSCSLAPAHASQCLSGYAYAAAAAARAKLLTPSRKNPGWLLAAKLLLLSAARAIAACHLAATTVAAPGPLCCCGHGCVVSAQLWPKRALRCACSSGWLVGQLAALSRGLLRSQHPHFAGGLSPPTFSKAKGFFWPLWLPPPPLPSPVAGWLAGSVRSALRQQVSAGKASPLAPSCKQPG